MGFIRRQEERLAIRFLLWKCERMNAAAPASSELQSQAEKIVDEAHRIVRETGGNLVTIIKEVVDDVKRGRSSR